MKLLKNLAKADLYRKIDPELTRGTSFGAIISIATLGVMWLLFFAELRDYLRNDVVTTMSMDKPTDVLTEDGRREDLIRVNFNITLERIPCPYVSIELHNSVGTHRTNITKNISKFKIKTKGSVQATIERMQHVEPARIQVQEEAETPPHDTDAKPVALTEKKFEGYVKEHDIVFVNFHAPWCVWCQRLEPVWEAAAHEFGSEFGARVGMGKVDCTDSEQVPLCYSNHINAFPTLIAFKNGDTHTHDMYHGDRTIEAFRAFLVKELETVSKPGAGLVPPEKNPGKQEIKAAELRDFMDGDGKHDPAVEGCRVEGFVTAPKVPSVLVVAPHFSSHSVDFARVNVSHVIHHLSFGSLFTTKELKILPGEVARNMHHLEETEFASKHSNETHEHYLKIVGTSYTYLHHGTLDTYKYTHYAAAFHSSETFLPTVRLNFDLSPVHVSVVEARKPLYRFLTNLCAIIGGTFTVFGLLDGVFEAAHRTIKKKVQLGKAA